MVEILQQQILSPIGAIPDSYRGLKPITKSSFRDFKKYLADNNKEKYNKLLNKLLISFVDSI